MAGGEVEIIDTVQKFSLLFVLLVWRTAECAGSVIRVTKYGLTQFIFVEVRDYVVCEDVFG